MPMSEDEQRQLRELEAQLGGQRRLASLAGQLGAASVYTGSRRIAALLAGGGAVALALVIAGVAVHRTAVWAAGIAVLAGTMVVAGVASIAVEVAGQRREHRLAQGRKPHPPPR